MIDFSNATVLSYTHTPQFLGNTLRYKIEKNITIEGLVLNLQNLDGISGIYSGINYLLSGVRDYDSILINGVNFGQGKITEFDFDRDDITHDVKYKKYRATMSVYDSGNLYNVITDYYSGLNWNNAQILDNFDESFNYTRSEDNSSQYTQQISLRFNSGQNLPDTPIGMAKTFASGFFNAINLTGFLGESYAKPYKKFYTETYNVIDNSASFRQEIQFPSESGVYALTYNHNFELVENGIINVTENGSIQGLYDPIYPSLQVGINTELPLAFNRCSKVYNDYAPSGTYPLNQNPIRKELVINKFEGIANFSLNYSNDPRYQNVYFWEYATTIDQNIDRVFTVTEAGRIVGIGRKLIDQYSNAKIGYGIVKTGILGRIYNAYSGANYYPLTLNLISNTEGFSQYQGNISYSTTYTDDITLFPASGIRKFEFEIADKIPVQAINKFNIVNVKELVQPTNQSTLGQRAISIRMVGNRNLPINNYVQYASGRLAPYKTIGVDIWTDSVNYNYDPINNVFGLNIGYSYDGDYKQFTDLIYSVTGL